MGDRVDELKGLLPQSIGAEPAAQRFLRGVLEPVAWIEALQNVQAQRLPNLLDPEQVPDELVPYLAALVGLGTDLPAVYTLSTDQLRRLIPVAIALWKRKGTRGSWREVILFLEGARSLIFDWFELRTTDGSALEEVLIPSPSTAPGGAYDYPEYVSDVWVMDTTGAGLDFDLLARWLAVVLPSNERINLYEAIFVEDLRVGTVLWDIEDLGALPPDGLRLDLAAEMADGSSGGLQSTAGNTFMWSSLIPATPDPDAGQHTFWLLAVAGQAELLFFSSGPLGNNAYALLITNDAGGGLAEAEVFRYTAGVPASLGAPFVLPQALTELWPYRWRVQLTRLNPTDTEIRVYWEAVELGSVIDAGSARTDGRAGFRAGPGATDRAIVQTVLIWRPPAERVRVGLDP